MVALSQGGFHSLSLTAVKYETLAPTLFHCHVYDTFSAHACKQFFTGSPDGHREKLKVFIQEVFHNLRLQGIHAKSVLLEFTGRWFVWFGEGVVVF